MVFKHQPGYIFQIFEQLCQHLEPVQKGRASFSVLEFFRKAELFSIGYGVDPALFRIFYAQAAE